MQILYISKEQLELLEELLQSKNREVIEKKVRELIATYCNSH